MVQIKVDSVEATGALAARLGAVLRPGDCLAYYGDLGAGKTTFTKGLARGAGYEGTVSSPTFVLMHIYEGRLPIYHFDAYRLHSSADLYNIGVDEYLDGDGVVCLEWSERVEDILPPARLQLKFTYGGGAEAEHTRFIEASGYGLRGEELLEALRAAAVDTVGVLVL